MKKIIFSVLILCIICLAGCSSRNDTVKTTPNSSISFSKDDSIQKFKNEASILSLYQNSKESATSVVSKEENSEQTTYSSFEEENSELTSYSSFEEENSEPTSYSSFEEENSEPTSYSSFEEENSELTSYSSFEEENSEPTSYSSFEEENSEPTSYSSFEEENSELTSYSSFEEENSEQISTNPADTKLAYGICKKECQVELENGETYPLYIEQQVAIKFINDTTYEIIWYPVTGIVPKENIEIYPDDFVPDFSKGQWAGCIYNQTETDVDTTPKKVLTYGICKQTCTIKVDQGQNEELFIGQQIGIVSYKDDQAQILWYDTSAWMDVENIEFYPENYVPDFSKGQWAGVITN